MQDERHPLSRSESIHDDVQRETDGVREQGFLLGTIPRPRIGLEHADAEFKWLLAPRSAPAELVKADPAGHGGEPAAQVLDALAAGPG